MPEPKKRLGRPKSAEGPIPKTVFNKRLRAKHKAEGRTEFRKYLSDEAREGVEEFLRKFEAQGGNI